MTRRANTAVLADSGLDVPMFVLADGVGDPFAGLGTPAAFVLDDEGVVAQPMMVGADQVPRLAADLAGVDAADGSVAIDGVRYLPAPGAVCGPGGGAGGARTPRSGRECARTRSVNTTWV